MFPIKHGVIYRTPEQHQPPDDTNLAGNTEYPNLNSRDYAKRPLNRHIRMHQAWECIALNTEQQAIIATNKLSGREWAGSIWGFEDVGDGTKLKPAKACYKLQCQTLISCLQYIADNIFLVAMRSGRVQVWSTKSEVRSPQTPYCMFLIGDKCEHMRPVTCMNVKANMEHAITGSKDGALKVWDVGCADLISIHTFRYAHTDVVTGVAASNTETSIFATCSLDHSALLWDDRLTRPAIALCEDHPSRFKNLAWADVNEISNDNMVYLGDESGFVHAVDKRLPHKFVQSSKCLNRPIHKIVPKGNKIAVIGDTNIVKIIEATDHSTIYTNVEAESFVRDGVWRGASELLTVGYEGKLRIHKLQ
ncbi:protein valois [Anastrepha obliqua]|uniref:protein valois n=1 Tax=Anastrepha obliqua TaxID=95512 RepID=UPI0024094EF3|nr:protein valois [Anastrepha obliqua]